MKVTITAPVRPTEDVAKVEAACTRWFRGASEVDDRRLRVTVDGEDAMDAFRARVWELRIIDTLRGTVLAGCEGPDAAFMISKQAALADRISIPVAAHPLGDIMVRVAVEPGDRWPDAEAFAWWLCPQTADGQIIEGGDVPPVPSADE